MESRSFRTWLFAITINSLNVVHLFIMDAVAEASESIDGAFPLPFKRSLKDKTTTLCRGELAWTVSPVISRGRSVLHHLNVMKAGEQCRFTSKVEVCLSKRGTKIASGSETAEAGR
jgi:hypothetical protein